MEVTLIEDAPVLIPNPSHKNFTRTTEVLKKGTKLNGEQKLINGLHRGKPFRYNLFYTDNNEIIYIKHIKPKNMNKTEVTLGADSAQSATKIEMPTNSNLGKRPVIGVVAGALVGYGFAKYRKVDGKKMYMYAAIGAVAGFVIGKYIQSHRDIKIVKSK